MAEFVIYEGDFFERWVAAELVSETPAFVVVQRLYQDKTRRIKKSNISTKRFATLEEAEKAAHHISSKLASAKRHYEQRKAAIIEELSDG